MRSMHKGIHRAYVHSAHDTRATIIAVYSLSYHMPAPPCAAQLYSCTATVVTDTNHKNPMKSTRAPRSSRGVQRGLGEMPDVVTQAHRGPRSHHGSKSQRASTEKRAGERYLPSRSNSTRSGTHHIIKRPDQAGIRVPARGPSHLHQTRGNNLNPATTCSYVEVVRGVAPRSGRPTMAIGPPQHPPQPTPVCAMCGKGDTTHSNGIKERVGGSCCARQRKD